MEKIKLVVVDRQKQKVISLKLDATFFFERAVQSLDRLHYEKALKYFRRAVDLESDNPVNHCNLAGILSEMGNYEQSNKILVTILETVDPTMTECYFYMANNYANMEDFESAEEAIIQYLEKDPSGQFLEESEEMIELISYELGRPTPLKSIKCREGLFEHDKARRLLEEGRHGEAASILLRLIKKMPDFLAARNNLALAYFYMRQVEKAMDTIVEVIELDPGNMHALCNMAIFYAHYGEEEKLAELVSQLRKTYPFHQDHVFKQATTMGILGEHETAYHLFKRLVRSGDTGAGPCLYHYTAVAAYNTGRYSESLRLWQQTEKLDPKSDISRFYLSQLNSVKPTDRTPISYHYHLPFEEQFRLMERSSGGIPDYFERNPLIHFSFFWALRHGDMETKLQVIQAFGYIANSEVENALRNFLQEPSEDDYLKKVAFFVLRNMGAVMPIPAILEGKQTLLNSNYFTPNLPVWDEEWEQVLNMTLIHMRKRYDMIQQHDMETLWVEFLTRVYPNGPKIVTIRGWAAALEYLTAKMHRRSISYAEVAKRYIISISTISRNVKTIDNACKLKEKMNAIFPQFASIVKQGSETLKKQ